MKSASSESEKQRVSVWNPNFARLAIRFRHDATLTGSLQQVLSRLPVSQHDEYN